MGIYSALLGLILGLFLEQLIYQYSIEQNIREYMINPGAKSLVEEPVAGLTAFIALVAYLSKSDPIEKASQLIVKLFSPCTGREPFVDLAFQIAQEQRELLNPDLLAECLMAKTASPERAEHIYTALQSITDDTETIIRLRMILAPRLQHADTSPLSILHLAPGATKGEIKAAFRKLAREFHPDSQRYHTETQKRKAAEHFMRIRQAYRQALQESVHTGDTNNPGAKDSGNPKS
ncbi:MAG: DnaJ domain-containing protein [Termitinemataceae bacterium]